MRHLGLGGLTFVLRLRILKAERNLQAVLG